MAKRVIKRHLRSMNKWAMADQCCKDHELLKANRTSSEIEDMDAGSLNYWLTNFVLEVAKESRECIHPELCSG